MSLNISSPTLNTNGIDTAIKPWNFKYTLWSIVGYCMKPGIPLMDFERKQEKQRKERHVNVKIDLISLQSRHKKDCFEEAYMCCLCKKANVLFACMDWKWRWIFTTVNCICVIATFTARQCFWNDVEFIKGLTVVMHFSFKDTTNK